MCRAFALPVPAHSLLTVHGQEAAPAPSHCPKAMEWVCGARPLGARPALLPFALCYQSDWRNLTVKTEEGL